MTSQQQGVGRVTALRAAEEEEERERDKRVEQVYMLTVSDCHGAGQYKSSAAFQILQ